MTEITREHLATHAKRLVQRVNHEEYELDGKVYVCGWRSPQTFYDGGKPTHVEGKWMVYPKPTDEEVLQLFLDADTIQNWDTLVQQLQPGQIQRIERLADQLCQRYARLSGYLSYRGASGCGDQGHDDANEESIKKETAVRKAIGYLN